MYGKSHSSSVGDVLTGPTAENWDHFPIHKRVWNEHIIRIHLEGPFGASGWHKNIHNFYIRFKSVLVFDSRQCIRSRLRTSWRGIGAGLGSLEFLSLRSEVSQCTNDGDFIKIDLAEREGFGENKK